MSNHDNTDDDVIGLGFLDNPISWIIIIVLIVSFGFVLITTVGTSSYKCTVENVTNDNVVFNINGNSYVESKDRIGYVPKEIKSGDEAFVKSTFVLLGTKYSDFNFLIDEDGSQYISIFKNSGVDYLPKNSITSSVKEITKSLVDKEVGNRVFVRYSTDNGYVDEFGILDSCGGDHLVLDGERIDYNKISVFGKKF